MRLVKLIGVMKIICAPDSFKESMTAEQAARAMQRGIHQVEPEAEIDLCPIADGGDGTVAAMLAATGGTARSTTVRGPLGDDVNADWGILGHQTDVAETAVIEMAAASGLALLELADRDATQTSTFGTGQLISAALEAGASRILLGIGGSATNDGGCGAAQALGVRFRDTNGDWIDQPMTGGLIPTVATIDMSGLDKRVQETRIIVACDVTNPMTGPDGAAHIYGPQKGATPQQVLELDQALVHLADLFLAQLSKEVQETAGSGAAGGLGAGLIAFLGANLESGVEMVLDASGFAGRVASCDLCLTGEGRLDGQSLSGKACLGVARVAQDRGVPTVALVGSVGPDVEKTLDAGLSAYHAISGDLPLPEAIRRGEELLEAAAAEAIRRCVSG